MIIKKNRSLFLWTVIMIAITITVYANHFHNAFQFDDIHTIVENTFIRNIHNLPLFFKDGSTSSTLPSNQAYRPLVTASLALDYWLGHGYNLFYFHLSNFILFLLQGLLMIALALKIYGGDNEKKNIFFVALVAATWYLLHPAMAETVNYVSARSDIQSTFFVVLALVLYAYSPLCKKYFLYLLPVAIGTLAKPLSVMFAPLFFLYMVLIEKKVSFSELIHPSFYRENKEIIPRAIVSFVVCGILFLLVQKMTPATWEPGGTSRFWYCVSQPFVILYYFITFFVPAGLCADYDWKLLTTLLDLRLLIGLLFLLLLIRVALISSRNKDTQPIGFGISWFLLSLIPTSSIIPLGEMLNDHRMYFPFVGLVIAVTWSLHLLLLRCITVFKIKSTRYISSFYAVLILTLLLYGYATVERNKVWHSGESLWHDVTIKSPDNPRGLMNYGIELMAKGNYTEAINLFQQTISIRPYYAYGYINLAIAKSQVGAPKEAEVLFQRALALNTLNPDCYSYYARFLMQSGRYMEAKEIIRKGLQISPQHSTLLNFKNANEQFIQQAQKLSSAETYLNLSLRYYNNGEYLKCIEAAKQSLQYKPDFDLAYNNICAGYNQLKQWDKAIEAGLKGLSFNPNNQLLKNNLAEAYKEKANHK